MAWMYIDTRRSSSLNDCKQHSHPSLFIALFFPIVYDWNWNKYDSGSVLLLLRTIYNFKAVNQSKNYVTELLIYFKNI